MNIKDQLKFISYRTVIALTLTLLFYILMIYQLFFLNNIFVSLIYVFLFFISYHFFFIEIKDYKTKYILIWLSIITLIWFIFVWFNDRHLLAWILLLNLSIFILHTDIEIPAQRRIFFNSTSFFTTWWYLFTVLIALTYSVTLLWISKDFPFSCDSLSNASNSVIETFTKPFKIWIDKANQLKDDAKSLFSSSIGEILSSPKKSESWFLWSKISDYKAVMIDQVIQDNTSINMWICDYILQEITKRYKNPVFQFSVILLMYLLFYPFLRIIFRLMSFIWLIIFKLLYLLKVYKIEKVKKEVEEIK